jgi:PAS domain S-box-containing protein
VRRRAAPFVVLLLLCAISPAVPHDPPPQGRWWIVAGVVLAVALCVGELGVRRASAGLIAAAPLLVIPAVQLLRAADGNAFSGFNAMLMLPILWYALYGTRTQLLSAIAGAAGVLLLPLVLIGAPEYPGYTTRGVLLLLVVMAALGLTVQQLVGATLAAVRRAHTNTGRFRAIFQHAPVGMALTAGEVTPTCRLTMVNRSLCALLGRDDATLRNAVLRELVHPADLEKLLACARQPSGDAREVRLVDRAGRTVWTSVSCVALQLADPAMDGQLIWQFDDITAERASAETVMDLLEAERRASHALRSTERQHRELLAAISHDLRTPITAALGYAEMLADGEYGEMTPSQQRTTEVISRSLTNLSRIINELVVIGPELARNDVPAGRAEVRALIDDAVHMVGIHAAMRNQTVLCTGDTDGLVVTGDEALLNRVFVNLLGNAVKFTPVGGTVTIAVEQDGELLAISVSDTGSGIPVAEQERIFERFYRAPQETNDPITRGSGLGLAIVKAIVTQHGGDVTLSSKPGHGATFTVRLPLATPSEAETDAVQPLPTSAQGKRSRAVVSSV